MGLEVETSGNEGLLLALANTLGFMVKNGGMNRPEYT
jgi:hypothetical protein